MKRNKELVAFEADFDDAVADLRLTSLPLRTALTGLWGVSDALLHENRFGSVPEMVKPHAGAALVSRFSYLAPLLLKCPLEPLGGDALDVLSPLQGDPSLLTEVGLLVQYGHFCELMPEVHRGYYTVAGDRTTGFVLEHPDRRVAEHECKDIVLSELALPFSIRTQPIPPRIIARIADTSDMAAFAVAAKARYTEVGALVVEQPVLTEAGYQAAVGVSAEEFGAYRSACFAIADCCLALAEEYAIRLDADASNNGMWRECLEWRNVCMKSDFVLALIEVLSGLSKSQVAKLTTLFSVGSDADRRSAASDGFFPPFWWLSDSIVMFNPDVLMLMLSARNIPFALNKLDKKVFDEKVSSHMEPALVAEVLVELAGFEIQAVDGANWASGEFDLLVFEPATNTAVHFQAKAAIPAQGARMVGAVETRSREGLAQLRVFRELPSEGRDSVLSSLLSRKVSGVEVVDVLLTRSGIGSWKIWEELGSVVPANPALIREARRRGATTLRELVVTLPRVLDDICVSASGGWNQTLTTFFNLEFAIPLLDLKNDYLGRLRLELAGLDAASSARDAAIMWQEVESRLLGQAPLVRPTKPSAKAVSKRSRRRNRKR